MLKIDIHCARAIGGIIVNFRFQLKITKELFKRWEEYPALVRKIDNVCQILQK